MENEYTRDALEGQMRTEMMTALQPAFARISEMGIRYSALPGHTTELAEALNQELSGKWSKLRGIEIVSLGVSGVKASEEDEQMIKELQRSAAFMDPTRAAAHLVGAQASAMQAAASNTAAGPAMAFMGMNQAAAAGGVNARDLYQMGGQQTAAQPQTAPAAGWTCSCGHTGNTGKFCAECGKPRPEAPAVWVCSCGAKNSGKFCSECGSPRPAAKCANCGFVPADPANPPKFCPECGKPLAVKFGKTGQFLACTGYPACRYTSNYTRDEQGQIHLQEKVKPEFEKVGTCPECGKDLVLKRSRTGSRFIACSGYPDCKHAEPYSTGVPCPREGCNGVLVEKSSKRGKIFYSCSNYPQCDYALWDWPIAEPAPNAALRYW